MSDVYLCYNARGTLLGVFSSLTIAQASWKEKYSSTGKLVTFNSFEDSTHVQVFWNDLLAGTIQWQNVYHDVYDDM